VTLLDSLFDAIIRLDGDALVMHVGEKPYVVLGSATVSALRGPLAWGQVELSSRPLTPSAMTTMLSQMLTGDQRRALDELGAIEEEIEVSGDSGGRFVVTAARGGDDVWVEVRRRKQTPAVVAEPSSESTEHAEFAVQGDVAAPPEETAGTQVAAVPALETSIDLTAEEVSAPAASAELADRIAALEREAAEALSAREAELQMEAQATLAARQSELEGEIARTLAEKEAALATRRADLEVEAARAVADIEAALDARRADLEADAVRALADREAALASNMNAAIAAKEAELVQRMEAAVAAKASELTAQAEAAIAARQIELNDQLASAIAAREAALRDDLQHTLALKEAQLKAQADAALAERESVLKAQIEAAASREAAAKAEAQVAAIAEQTQASLAEREAALRSEADAARRATEAAAAAEVERILTAKTAEISADAQRAVAEKEAALLQASQATIAAREAEVAAEVQRVLAEKQAALEAEAERILTARQAAIAEFERALAEKEAALRAEAERHRAESVEARRFFEEKESAIAAEAQRATERESQRVAELQRTLAEKEAALGVHAARLAEKEAALATDVQRALAEKEAAIGEARRLAEKAVALSVETQRAFAEKEQELASQSRRTLAEKEAALTAEMQRTIAAREAALAEKADRAIAEKLAALAAEAQRRLVEREAALEARIAQLERERAATELAHQAELDAMRAADAEAERIAERLATLSTQVEAEAAAAELHVPPAPTPITIAAEPPAAVVRPIARPPLKLQPAQPPAPAAAASTEASLVEVLRAAAEHGASIVYALVDTRPSMRLSGEIAPVGTQAPVAAGDVERFIFQFAPRELVADATPEWTCAVPDVGRVRCVVFQDHSGAGLIFHLPSREAPVADDVSIGDQLRALCDEADGLIVVAGPRSSGKSALLSDFVDVINSTRYDHVITIESQIRRLHEKRLSFISQREVRGDGDAIAKAARAALREGPDVLVIEDLRAPEALVAALDAARAGRLVFGSISAPTTPGAIERLIDAFPADRRPQVRASLAGALRAVVAQILVAKIAGGRIAAREVLLSSPAVRQVILDGGISQLPIAIESGRNLGMRTMVDALGTLVRNGVVSIATACAAAPDRAALVSALERDGIDVSGVERRA